MTEAARELREQMDRIERKLDALLSRKRATGKGSVKRSVAVAHRAAAEVRTVPDELTRAYARRIAKRKGLIR